MANKNVGQLPDASLPLVDSDSLLVSRDGVTLSKVNFASIVLQTNESASEFVADNLAQSLPDVALPVQPSDSVLISRGSDQLAKSTVQQLVAESPVIGGMTLTEYVADIEPQIQAAIDAADVASQASQEAIAAANRAVSVGQSPGTSIQGVLFAGFFQVESNGKFYLIPRFVESNVLLKSSVVMDFLADNYTITTTEFKKLVDLNFIADTYTTELV